VAQAQEEARLLDHPYIGTEHILLGVLRVQQGVAAQALAQLDISLQMVRTAVVEALGDQGSVTSPESPPFTPRAKKVLELALREALQLGHNYIGTEHLLLGIVGEGEGVAARVLVSLGADPSSVRQSVLWLLAAYPGGAPRKRRALESGPSRPRLVTCSFCGRRAPETGRIIASGRATICEHCIGDWHARLGEPPQEPTDPPSARLLGPMEDFAENLAEDDDE
jgi:ATP-dependent Clp protease ATP-binding subunit ClpC